MKEFAPFKPADLAELEMRLLDQASAVIAMVDVHDGNLDAGAIAMRHDVDAGHALATAVRLAEWEAERGYRSTYYMLHTSPYWDYAEFRDSLERIAGLGHEIGIHANALAESLRTGIDPDVILDDALERLRAYGHDIRGVAGHGDPFCNRDRGPGEITFANDEQFVECARPKEGPPDRVITRGRIERKLRPRPLAEFGLEYEAIRVAYPVCFRISDSGGKWLNPGFEETVAKWQGERARYREVVHANRDVQQLHFLLHPDWWAEALPLEVAA